MRECDVSDDEARRSMYGVILTQGQRNDVARYLNPGFLRADWPLIRDALDPKLRGACERRFALGGLTGPAQAPAEVWACRGLGLPRSGPCGDAGRAGTRAVSGC
jgi:hypothetical protein